MHLAFPPRHTGTPIADLRTLDGQEFGNEMAAAAEQGRPGTLFDTSPGAPEMVRGRAWSIRRDGLRLGSHHRGDRPEVLDVPDVAESA